MHKINNTTFILLLNIRLWLEEFFICYYFQKRYCNLYLLCLLWKMRILFQRMEWTDSFKNEKERKTNWPLDPAVLNTLKPCLGFVLLHTHTHAHTHARTHMYKDTFKAINQWLAHTYFVVILLSRRSCNKQQAQTEEVGSSNCSYY